MKQGYDDRLKSWDQRLNMAHPGGKPISPNNPLPRKNRPGLDTR